MMLCWITPQRAKSLLDHKSFSFHKRSLFLLLLLTSSLLSYVNGTYENEISSETSSSGKELNLCLSIDFYPSKKALSALVWSRNSYLGEHLFKSLIGFIFRKKLWNLDNVSAFATFCQSVFSRLHKSQLVSQNLDMSISQKRNSFLLI